MGWVPTVRVLVVKVAVPALRGRVARVVGPSVKVMVPVRRSPEGAAGLVRVAVKVTDWL